MGLSMRHLFGKDITEDKSANGWRVENGTKPVNRRHFNGKSIDWDRISCYDEKEKKYINVEYFSPVLYDLDNQQPKYDIRWETYDSGGKNKKIIKINFPLYYLEWWTKQRQRCLNGYTVGGVYITGIHYFYLNFWRIKPKKKGSKPIAPRFLDLDKMFFDDIHRAYQLGKNYLCLKRRQIGMSEKVMAIIAWNYTFFPGSESLIVAGESQFADQSFSKLKTGLDELSRNSDSNAADPFYRRKLIDNDTMIKSGYNFKGVDRGFKSIVYKRVAKHNSQIASGLSVLSTVFFEEAGRFPDMDIVDGMITPIMEEGGAIGEGKIKIYVGTGGEMDKGAALLEQYFYNPEEYNLLDFDNEWEDSVEGIESTKCARFFPAWYYYCTDYDGNSYKEIGEVLINEARSKIKDPTRLHVNKTQMPLLPSEAFIVGGECPFNVVKLDAQRSKLIRHNVKSTYLWGRLDPIVENGITVGQQWTTGNPSEFDADGDLKYPILLMSMPLISKDGKPVNCEGTVMKKDNQYVNLYFGGTDSYDKPDAPTSSSLGSMSVFMGDLDESLISNEGRKYVARLTWRPKLRDKFFEMTARLSMFYNCENLIEWSNLTIFDYYKNNSYSAYLKERPIVAYANQKDSTANNKYGVDPSTKDIWENLYGEYIEMYSDRMMDFTQVDRARAYRKSTAAKRYNCDVSIGAQLAYVNYKDSSSQKLKATEVNAPKKKKGIMKGLGFKRIMVGHRLTIARN